MNDLAKKWVEALRSGKYKKTTECLAKYGGFCVLGVACDVAVKNGIDVEVKKEYSDEYEAKITTYDGEEISLPEKVWKALGLVNANGAVGTTSLSMLNDHSNLSLKDLADLIEFAAPLLFEENQ